MTFRGNFSKPKGSAKQNVLGNIALDVKLGFAMCVYLPYNQRGLG
jgi:hypothetical protein